MTTTSAQDRPRFLPEAPAEPCAPSLAHTGTVDEIASDRGEPARIDSAPSPPNALRALFGWDLDHRLCKGGTRGGNEIVGGRIERVGSIKKRLQILTGD